MKKIGLIAFIVCMTCMAFTCENDDEETTQEEDQAKLEIMYKEIIDFSLAGTQSCTDSKDWDFTGIGARSCGGFQAYIVYSKKINTAQFLNKVKDYTDAEAAYNKKWGVGSICSVENPPKKIECVEGKPKMIYN